MDIGHIKATAECRSFARTLRNLVQEYIGREDATYYGVRPEMTIEEKIDVVIAQIRSGDAAILWNTNLESGTIVLKKGVV